MTIQLPNALTPVVSNREQKQRYLQYVSTLEKYLDAYNIVAKVREVNPEGYGIQICIEIAVGTPIDSVLKHQNGIATILAAPYHRIKIEAPVPGRNLIGITIPWVYPYPDISSEQSPMYRTEGMWLFNISKYFFQLSEKIGGSVVCRAKG